MATRFFCDSNCELCYTEVDRLNLEEIRMPYILDGVEYLYDFGRNTDFESFYASMKAGSMPTTAALNELNYTELFEPVFKAGDDIFYIAFSSKLSGTFHSMNMAVAELLKVYPDRKFTHFDTKAMSAGAGIQVYYAMELKNSGASDAEVLEFLNDFSKKVRTLFSVDDLHHLKKGGRVSGTAAALGTMLGIKPILRVDEEGFLTPLSKVRGTNLVYKYFTDAVKETAIDLDKYNVWILHANCLDRAENLKKRVEEVTKGKACVKITMVGPVIASHCGAGTLGIVFPSKTR